MTARPSATSARLAAPLGLPRRELSVLMTTAVILLICLVAVEGFATLQNFVTILRSVSVLGILGIGMAITVIGRGLDLSQVAIMVMSVGWTLSLASGDMAPGFAVASGFCLALAFGAINAVLIHLVGMSALVATLATGASIAGFGRWILLPNLITYVPESMSWVVALGQSGIAGIPYAVIVLSIVAATTQFAFSRTMFGRDLYALGDNPEAAHVTGLPVGRTFLLQYLLSAAIAYIAGLVSAGTIASVNTQVASSSLIFDVLLVIVLGGVALRGARGSVLSVLIGTVMIGVLLNAMILMNLKFDIQNILKGLVLIVALVIDRRLSRDKDDAADLGKM